MPSMPPPKQSAFRVLERHEEAVNPSTSKAHYPKLLQVPAPHIGSFNSLFQFGSTGGLLDASINTIPKVVVFDGQKGQPLNERNKIECKRAWLGFLSYRAKTDTYFFLFFFILTFSHLLVVWLSAPVVGRPVIEGMGQV